MIATASMWYSIGRMYASEAEHGEVEMEDDAKIPLHVSLGPLLVDAWSFWCLATVVGGA